MTIDSITRQVRAMKPKRYTVRDAAEAVGRSPDTLRRWRVTGEFVPSDTATFGTTIVYLYTADDIRAMKKIAQAQRPGPKKGSTQQRRNSDASSTTKPAAPKGRKGTRRTTAR
jgi:hypothetical protein